MNKYISFLILLLLFSLSPVFVEFAFSQPPPPPPDPIPIDGGISILVAAGVAYAAKKLYSNNKQKNEL